MRNHSVQLCKYCDKPATKKVAAYDGYVRHVCDEHETRAKRHAREDGYDLLSWEEIRESET